MAIFDDANIFSSPSSTATSTIKIPGSSLCLHFSNDQFQRPELLLCTAIPLSRCAFLPDDARYCRPTRRTHCAPSTLDQTFHLALPLRSQAKQDALWNSHREQTSRVVASSWEAWPFARAGKQEHCTAVCALLSGSCLGAAGLGVKGFIYLLALLGS